MPQILPITDYTKRIAHPAPYSPVTFSDHLAHLYQRSGGVLFGLNVVPQSAIQVKIFPGAALMTNGVSVEILNPITVDVPTAITVPAFIYVSTPDELPTTDVTVDISDAASLPDGVVVLAELTTSLRWIRRHTFGIDEIFRHVKGGLISNIFEQTSDLTHTHALAVSRFEFETDHVLTAMIFGAGIRFKHLLSGTETKPLWKADIGRKDLTIKNLDSGGSPVNWATGDFVEAIANRDIIFQSEQTANGSETTFVFPTGETIVPGSNEILVFIDGKLELQSEYTEAASSVTLNSIKPFGTEVALVKIRPVLFRETVTAPSGGFPSGLRLSLNSFITGNRQLMVFVAGKKLIYPRDYTEQDGETVLFTTQPTVGDKVEVVGIRSAFGGSTITSISTTSPITGGGESGDITIGFNISAIDAEVTPAQVAAVGAIGSNDGRFARQAHVHKQSFPLSTATPLGVVLGGSPGSGVDASKSDHRHPSEGALVTTPNRTIPIILSESKVWNIPQGHGILTGEPIAPAGPIQINGHQAYLFYGDDPLSDPLPQKSGIRFKFVIPTDYSVGSDLDIGIHYALDGKSPGAAFARFRYTIKQDGIIIVPDTLVLLTPPILDAGAIAFADGSSGLSSTLAIPQSALVATSVIQIDWLREADNASDTLNPGVAIIDFLVRYTG